MVLSFYSAANYGYTSISLRSNSIPSFLVSSCVMIQVV
nr:MAG TPA: hypothetical protein [Caudoviricetes sp.]